MSSTSTVPSTDIEVADQAPAPPRKATTLELYNDAFEAATSICKSNLIPAAYRGKPQDAAIAILYGAEVGLPPMTALQRIVVVEGKPGLDAQGMAALIRSHGHELGGEADSSGATVTSRRADTGEEMTVTFTMEDARRAGLVNKNTYKGYPSDMCWARAVSRIGRRLYPELMQGVSYGPDEIREIETAVPPTPESSVPVIERLRPPPVADDDIDDAEVVTDGDESASYEEPPAPATKADRKRIGDVLRTIEDEDARKAAMERLGVEYPPSALTTDKVEGALEYAQGLADVSNATTAEAEGDDAPTTLPGWADGGSDGE